MKISFENLFLGLLSVMLVMLGSMAFMLCCIMFYGFWFKFIPQLLGW